MSEFEAVFFRIYSVHGCHRETGPACSLGRRVVTGPPGSTGSGARDRWRPFKSTRDECDQCENINRSRTQNIYYRIINSLEATPTILTKCVWLLKIRRHEMSGAHHVIFPWASMHVPAGFDRFTAAIHFSLRFSSVGNKNPPLICAHRHTTGRWHVYTHL